MNDVELAQRDMEVAVLSIILQWPERIPETRAELHPDEFWTPEHRLIFTAICSMDDAGEPVDLVTVYRELADRKEQSITLVYLNGITESVATSVNLPNYIAKVKEDAKRRKVARIAQELLLRSNDLGIEVDELIGFMDEKMNGLNGKSKTSVRIGDTMGGVFERLEAIQENGATLGLETGFYDFDQQVGGLQRREFSILAARPSVGKTALALDIARWVSVSHDVFFFSLEMGLEQIAERCLCATGGIPTHLFRLKDKAMPKYWQEAANAASAVKQLRLTVDDTAVLRASEVAQRSKVWRQKHSEGAALIILDYIQLLQGEERGMNREQEVASISRRLKIIAKTLNVHVMALSQLSRATEARKDGRPQLSDLRESGAIEQDADMVMFLWRPGQYERGADKEETKLILAKNRTGPTGDFDLRFVPQYARFNSAT